MLKARAAALIRRCASLSRGFRFPISIPAIAVQDGTDLSRELLKTRVLEGLWWVIRVEVSGLK